MPLRLCECGEALEEVTRMAMLGHVCMVDPTRETFEYALLLQTARVAPERMPGWKRHVALSVRKHGALME